MAWVQDRCMLVLDRWKGCHELPGGTNTDGESLRVTAAREFTEQTGIVAPGLELIGVATFELGDLPRREHAAIFETHLEMTAERADQLVADFAANDEIDALVLWDPRSTWASAGGRLDAAIVRWRQGVSLSVA
jgi:ADP-ribose pyrophosphatase YjhB (NUDIX family)